MTPITTTYNLETHRLVPGVEAITISRADVYAAIERALRHYRAACYVDDEGAGLPLADIFTPDGEPDISTGLHELDLLRDDIAHDVLEKGKDVTPAPAMTREQAIALARDCAERKPQSYTLPGFDPHEWVIDAIMRASAGRSASFQSRVQLWMMECFGPEISADRIERNHRFLEEAIELVQANGCTQSEAHQLVDYVYGRPKGEINQEVGGVMVTLAALCLASGVDMHAAGETELARIWTKVDVIRAKQAAKPRHSPLPQVVTPAPAMTDDFNGDTPHLIGCIKALLSMDAAGVLVPQGLGIGGHARTLLRTAAARLSAPQPVPAMTLLVLQPSGVQVPIRLREDGMWEADPDASTAWSHAAAQTAMTREQANDALSEVTRKEFERELRARCDGFADEYYKCERGIESASAASVNGKFKALLHLVHTYVFSCGTARIEGYKEALARSATPSPYEPQLVQFVGIDPLNIGAGATLPMIADSWRFAFTRDASGVLRFAFCDDGPLVAYAATSPLQPAPADARDAERFNRLYDAANELMMQMLLSGIWNKYENAHSNLERALIAIDGGTYVPRTTAIDAAIAARGAT